MYVLKLFNQLVVHESNENLRTSAYSGDIYRKNPRYKDNCFSIVCLFATISRPIM
jgi:hypothetical protein